MSLETAKPKEGCDFLRRAETIRYEDINQETKRFNNYTDEKTLLTQRLVEALSPNSTSVVLDVGPGEGYFLTKISKRVRKCVGVEPDPTLLEALRRRFRRDSNVEIVGSKFEDFETKEKFDAVVASHTLSFFEDKLAMIAKMASHTKEGGIVVIVAHSVLGKQYQILELFDKQFRHGELFHVSAESVHECLESMGFAPTMKRVATRTILPSLEVALSLGYFLFRQKLISHEPMARRTAISLLGDSVVNNRIQIDTVHGMVLFRKGHEV